jgi:hypothetical protein
MDIKLFCSGITGVVDAIITRNKKKRLLLLRHKESHQINGKTCASPALQNQNQIYLESRNIEKAFVFYSKDSIQKRFSVRRDKNHFFQILYQRNNFIHHLVSLQPFPPSCDRATCFCSQFNFDFFHQHYCEIKQDIDKRYNLLQLKNDEVQKNLDVFILERKMKIFL